MHVSLQAPSRGLGATETLPSEGAKAAAVSNESSTPEPSAFARVLQGLGHDVESGETATRTAIRSLRGGADLSPGQLIALQAGVYRYSEAIDLASRLVDRATNGVRTVVQSGGQ